MSSDAQMSWLLRTTAKRLENVFETADQAGEEIRSDAQTEAQGYIEEARRQSRQYTEQARQQGEQAREQAVRTAKDRLERISALNEELTALTEELLTQTAGVQRQSEVVREALQNASRTLSGELGAGEEISTNGGSGAATAAGPLRPPNTTGPAASAKRRVKRRRKFVAPQDGSPVSEGARVLALQAFVAGEEPQRIERRLREDFGIEDPSAVLASVQGSAPGAAD